MNQIAFDILQTINMQDFPNESYMLVEDFDKEAINKKLTGTLSGKWLLIFSCEAWDNLLAQSPDWWGEGKIYEFDEGTDVYAFPLD